MENIMIPFSYAIIDDEGEVIRKHRWSVKEAKWFTDNNPDVKVVKLEQPPKLSMIDRKSTRLNSSHVKRSRMPSSA